MEKNFYKGVVCIILSAVFWGLGGVSGQYLYTYQQTDPFWLCMVRQIIAGALFLLFTVIVKRENIFAIFKDFPLQIIIFSFLGILGAQLGFYYTISLCNAATATVLQYMAPIFVMVWMAYKSRSMPEGKELLGIVGALLGVFLISTHGNLDSLAISPEALIIGILSAVSYALYSVYPLEMLKKYSATIVIGWGQLISGLSLIAYRNPFVSLASWDAGAYMAMAYLVIGATTLTYALYMYGLKIVGPTKASLISCAEPLTSIVAVVLFMDTILTMEDIIGMVCIIFTVLLLSLPKK